MFMQYEAIKLRISCPLPWQPLCATLVGGVLLMLASRYEVDVTTYIMELCHILSVHIICPCDLDLRPIYTKIGSRDQNPIIKIPSYFEVYRPLRF